MKYVVACAITLVLLMTPNAWAVKSCVSIKPLHSIVANITKGIESPELILDRAYANLHLYALKPSDSLKIKGCELVFIISEDFEHLSAKLKNIVDKNAKIVTLGKNKDIKLLPTRENNIFTENSHHEHNHDDEEHNHGHDHHHSFYDYHIWLDTDNVKAMALAISEALVMQDETNKTIYEHNLKNFITRLDHLDETLKVDLTKVHHIPYLVFHDGYQYFENKYKLNSIGAIAINSSHSPGAKTLAKIKQIVLDNKVKCIFKEPQFPSMLVEKISASAQVKIGTLNAEWADSSNDEDVYFVLMKNLAKNMKDCLE